jgi:NAD(P)-dependent dehydrogenase (short-subunit alcohol dehydrogenase family)
MSSSPGRVALISGASSGIGRATAVHLAQRGFRVFGTSRHPAASSTDHFELVPLDVTSDDSVSACVDTVLDRASRIDVLVSNAGYLQAGAVEECTPAEAQAQFDTNVFGTLRLARAVLPGMRERGAGRIIVTSSILAHLGIPYAGLYAASKYAVEGLMEALAFELRPFGIFVSLVEPSFVKTSIGDSAQRSATALPAYAAARRRASARVRDDIEHGAEPEEVAALIVRVAQSNTPRLRYQVGPNARSVYLLKRFLPEPLFLRIMGARFDSAPTSAAPPQPVAVR